MSQIFKLNDQSRLPTRHMIGFGPRTGPTCPVGKAFVAAGIWLAAIGAVHAQVDDDSPRVTPLVKVIRRIEPSIVALFTPSGNQLVSGSGLVIHGDGYILTNNHVLPRPEGFALVGDRKPIPFRVIARVPESDIALVKLIDPPENLPAMKFGHSSDLINGEKRRESSAQSGRRTYPSGQGVASDSRRILSRERRSATAVVLRIRLISGDDFVEAANAI